MTSEKSKEDYYRDAAQYLNTGERVVSDSGDRVSGTLAFLTRGRNHTFATLAISDGISRHSAASDWVHGRRPAFF
jgi:RNA polymerase-associated protein CTR9